MLKVDKEFRDLLPPLSDAEKEELRQQIIEHGGARDPVVVWKGHNVVVEGHNRHEICGGEGLPFDTVEKVFANRGEVKRWIMQNQLGRRNLPSTVASTLRGKLYNATKGKSNGTNAAATIAKATGKSERTVKRDGKRAEAVEKMTPAARKHADKLTTTLCEFVASMPRAEQAAQAKQLAASDPAGKAAKSKAKAKAAKPEVPPAEEKAALQKSLAQLARRTVALRSRLGTKGGQSVVDALDALSQSLNRWKV